TAQYDVFNKPTRIGNTQFVYGPTHEKVKTISGGTTTYHYAGGSYLEESTGTSVTSKAYVGGYYLRETTAGVITEHYLHFDHLGSVEAISDADGNFVSRMSFDAFGNRRNANWTALAAPPTTNAFATDWGFTGHDMVDAEAVVHMGGRVYDPAIGRFLSADLYVQAPDNSQSYNRYSYTFNNPLSFVDPTGYATTCTRGETTKWVCRGDGTTLAGDAAEWFMRDMEFYNSDWRQMADSLGNWTGLATETLVDYSPVPALIEGGFEIYLDIKKSDCAAAIGAGLMTGVEFAARKIKNAKKVAEEGLKAAKEVTKGAGKSARTPVGRPGQQTNFPNPNAPKP